MGLVVDGGFDPLATRQASRRHLTFLVLIELIICDRSASSPVISARVLRYIYTDIEPDGSYKVISTGTCRGSSLILKRAKGRSPVSKVLIQPGR